MSKSLWVIRAIDDQSPGPADPPNQTGRNGTRKRLDSYKAHKAYQASVNDVESPNYIRKITAGPLVNDDATYNIGSFIIVEASSREEVEHYYKNDPFYINGVWGDVSVERHISLIGVKEYAPSS